MLCISVNIVLHYNVVDIIDLIYNNEVFIFVSEKENKRRTNKN